MKKKLFAAALSLAMASILMVSSSFAWFTVSTAPEVSNIQVSMGTTKNLEIANITANTKTTAPGEVTANDTGKTGTWGGTATFGDAAGGIQFPIKEINAQGVVNTIKYGSDYRTSDAVQALTLTAKGDMDDNGVQSYAANIDTNGDGTADTNLVVAASYTVWMRSNVASAEVKAALASDNYTFTGFKNSTGANKLDNSDVIVAVYDGTKYVPLSTTATKVLTLNATANTAQQVTIYVFVKGDKIFAEDMTKSPAPTISGIKVNFSSDQVSNPAAVPAT